MTGTFEQIQAAVSAEGLVVRGAVHLAADERIGILEPMRSLVLIGFAGRIGWDSFVDSAEARDGIADPLDRWSRRIVDDLARQLGAAAVYPFGEAPFWPFQQWAQRAETLFPSPLGLLIHPTFGLWHSYRGALAFADVLEPAQPHLGASPCDSCADKPCLNACPVSAFAVGGYDVEACATWLRSDRVSACMTKGCLARHACPVGKQFAPAPAQASFTMRAFLSSRH